MLIKSERVSRALRTSSIESSNASDNDGGEKERWTDLG